MNGLSRMPEIARAGDFFRNRINATFTVMRALNPCMEEGCVNWESGDGACGFLIINRAACAYSTCEINEEIRPWRRVASCTNRLISFMELAIYYAVRLRASIRG